MNNVIENDYKVRKNLPVGHIDRYKAKKALKNEYRCHAVESFWNKKRGYRHNKKAFNMSVNEALQFCNILCDEFGYRHVKRLVINSKEAKEKHCGGFYCSDQIYLANYCNYSILIHELCHHFQRIDRKRLNFHCKRFAIAVSMLNAVAHKIITGKNIKSDWIEKADKIIDESYKNDMKINNFELMF